MVRNLVRTVLSLSLGISGCLGLNTDLKSPAASCYSPLKITSSGRVEEFMVPDSAYTLIHIRQLHEPIDRKIPYEDKNRIENVHKEIAAIIRKLHNDSNLKGIYMEGVDSKLAANLNEYISAERESKRGSLSYLEKSIKEDERNLLELESRLSDLESRTDISQEQIDSFKNALESLKKAQRILEKSAENVAVLRNKMPVSHSTIIDFAMETGLEIRASEIPEIYKRATDIAAMGIYSGKEFERYVLNDREDSVLALVSSREDPLAIVVYGGRHDFRDNVAFWNSIFPDKKFSLVVIHPKAYYK